METCKNVGFELWQARKSCGLSRVQLAKKTKLRVGQIEALESNAFEQLPPLVYLRGHLAVYASEVGLDPHDIVPRYLAQFGATVPSVAAVAHQGLEAGTPSWRLPGAVARVAMLAVIVLAGWLFFSAPASPTTAALNDSPVVKTAPVASVPQTAPSYSAIVARSRSIANAHLQ